MPTSCLPRGVPSLATGFAPAGFGLLGPFLQRHGKPNGNMPHMNKPLIQGAKKAA